MIINSKLKKETSIVRSGELRSINLPKGNKPYTSYDILINVANREMNFVDGDTIFVIEEEIGIGEETEFTVFTAGNYFVVEIHWGRVYFRDSKDKVQYITETGYITHLKTDDNEIKWLSLEDIESYLGVMVSTKYNLKDKKRIKSYIDNLAFTVISANVKLPKPMDEESSNKHLSRYMFRFRVKDFYSDLGLDMFEYIVHEKEEKPCEPQEDNQRELEEWRRQRQLERAERHKVLQEEMEYKRIKDGDDSYTPELEKYIDMDIDDDLEDLEESEIELEEDDALLRELDGFSIIDLQ